MSDSEDRADTGTTEGTDPADKAHAGSGSEQDDGADNTVVSGDEDPTEDSPDSDSDDSGGTILDDGGVDTDERAGRSQGIDPTSEPDEETKQEIEEEREKRLDPDNRPDGAEVDNTDRTFDVDRGQFTDAEDYDDSEPAPFSDPEDPNNPDNEGDGDSDSGSHDQDDDSDDQEQEADSDDDAEEEAGGDEEQPGKHAARES